MHHITTRTFICCSPVLFLTSKRRSTVPPFAPTMRAQHMHSYSTYRRHDVISSGVQSRFLYTPTNTPNTAHLHTRTQPVCPHAVIPRPYLQTVQPCTSAQTAGISASTFILWRGEYRRLPPSLVVTRALPPPHLVLWMITWKEWICAGP